MIFLKLNYSDREWLVVVRVRRWEDVDVRGGIREFFYGDRIVLNFDIGGGYVNLFKC